MIKDQRLDLTIENLTEEAVVFLTDAIQKLVEHYDASLSIPTKNMTN